MGKVRDFKFGIAVDHSQSYLADDKPSPKGAWSRSYHLFRILHPLNISGTTVKFPGISLTLWDSYSPCVTHFKHTSVFLLVQHYAMNNEHTTTTTTTV